MSTFLRALVMTLDATGTVSFWESSPPSRSIRDARSLIERFGVSKVLLPRGRVLGVVVTATGHRPRLIPSAGCSESAQRAWSFGCWSLGLTPRALQLPEGPAGATIL